MKIEQFFYAVEIADTGSFSQAARNLYVSQPNLSHAIKQIERELGFPLFIRSATGVIPTAEGSAVIDHFRIIKREYEQVAQFLHTPDYHHHDGRTIPSGCLCGWLLSTAIGPRRSLLIL